MTGEATDLRALSAVVCGARYRLEILCAIAEKRTFTATELLRELWRSDDPPSQSTVSVELKRLRENGLIQRQGGSSTERSIYLEAVDSPVWDAVKSMVGSK